MKLLLIMINLIVTSSTFANENLDTKLRKLLQEEGINPIHLSGPSRSALFVLGEKLFSEKALSGNKNISCQTCHHPNLGTSDNLPLGIGEGGVGLGQSRRMGEGRVIARHSPHVFNTFSVDSRFMFWDGRVKYSKENHIFTTPHAELNGVNPKRKDFTSVLTSALAAQALFPPLSHDEMLGAPGTNELADIKDPFIIYELLVSRILKIKGYPELFKRAFKIDKLSEVNFAHIAEAIAHFEEMAFSKFNSPFDHYLKGSNHALTEKQKRGAIAFYSSARCFMCHKGIAQRDDKFHNVAFPQIGPGKEQSRDDKGRFYVTNEFEDLYGFKTPSLRNVAKSAPYGHSGSMETLKSVVRHYSHPMRANHHYQAPRGLPYPVEMQTENMRDRLRNIDPLISMMGIPMNEEDIDNIVEFLKVGLTDL